MCVFVPSVTTYGSTGKHVGMTNYIFGRASVSWQHQEIFLCQPHINPVFRRKTVPLGEVHSHFTPCVVHVQVIVQIEVLHLLGVGLVKLGGGQLGVMARVPRHVQHCSGLRSGTVVWGGADTVAEIGVVTGGRNLRNPTIHQKKCSQHPPPFLCLLKL